MNCTAISQTFIDTHRQEIRTTLLVLAAISAALALLAATDALLPNHISNVLKYPQANAVSFTLLSLAFLSFRAHLEKKAPKPPIGEASPQLHPTTHNVPVSTPPQPQLQPVLTKVSQLNSQIFNQLYPKDLLFLRLLNKSWRQSITQFMKDRYRLYGGPFPDPTIKECSTFFDSQGFNCLGMPTLYSRISLGLPILWVDDLLLISGDTLVFSFKYATDESDMRRLLYFNVKERKPEVIYSCTFLDESYLVQGSTLFVCWKGKVQEWNLEQKKRVAQSDKLDVNSVVSFEDGKLTALKGDWGVEETPKKLKKENGTWVLEETLPTVDWGKTKRQQVPTTLISPDGCKADFTTEKVQVGVLSEKNVAKSFGNKPSFPDVPILRDRIKATNSENGTEFSFSYKAEFFSGPQFVVFSYGRSLGRAPNFIYMKFE